MITSILIAPAGGWCDEAGGWRAGATQGNLVEAELTRALATEIGDALDAARLRWAMLPVDKHPGVSPAERLRRIEPGMLVLHLGFPATTEGTGTRGVMRYPARSDTAPLLEVMTEALKVWGRTYCHPYLVSTPRPEPFITAGAVELVVEPFALDQPGAPALATRLRSLAEGIVWAVGEFLLLRPHGAALGRIYGGRCW